MREFTQLELHQLGPVHPVPQDELLKLFAEKASS